MYIPVWILIIAMLGIGFYYYNKKRANSRMLNKKDPTYDEMLKLSEKEFQQWLLIRNETDREKLLAEMIDHEERTGSFSKTAKKEITKQEQLVLDVFNREKSREVIKWLEKLKGFTGYNAVQEAIFAKASSDHVRLEEKLKK